MAAKRGIRIGESNKNILDWLQENIFDIPCTHDRVVSELIGTYFLNKPEKASRYNNFLKKAQALRKEGANE